MIYSISRGLYNFFSRHIVLYTLLASLPSAMFALIDYFGKQLGLYDKSNSLTLFSKNCIICSIALSVLLVLAKAIADKYDSSITSNGVTIANLLLNVTKDTKESKYGYYKGFISDSSKKSICKYMAPAQEINRLLRRFRSALSDITDIDQNEIGISIFFKFGSQAFRRISTENIDSDPNYLINKANSTISSMKREGLSILFFPDKRKGIANNQYIVGSKDKANKNIGSIYCERINVSTDSHTFIESYISITTYGIQICKENDKNTIDKFRHIIVPVLIDQLKIELSKLYIAEYKICPNRD
jgi:hypothetical protein